MDAEHKSKIAREFEQCVTNTIQRVKNTPATNLPFHSALLSEEVMFWSRFERSFSTSFGSRVIEKIAELAALANGAEAVGRQVQTILKIDLAHETAINNHINQLRSGKRTEPWDEVIEQIRKTPSSGKIISTRIISDLWWKKDGIDHYISLKTVKPNIDQTIVAKIDCLRLTICNQECKAFFGLPYNPYGETHEQYAHNPPLRVFDFKKDPVVLIGRELWDMIGGTGCYDEILEIAKNVGIITKELLSNIKK